MGQTEVVRLLSENLQQEENTAQNLEMSMPTLLKQAVQTASKSA
jgi:ferritin-like metal-binding protein YciE